MGGGTGASWGELLQIWGLLLVLPFCAGAAAMALSAAPIAATGKVPSDHTLDSYALIFHAPPRASAGAAAMPAQL